MLIYEPRDDLFVSSARGRIRTSTEFNICHVTKLSMHIAFIRISMFGGNKDVDFGVFRNIFDRDPNRFRSVSDMVNSDKFRLVGF